MNSNRVLSFLIVAALMLGASATAWAEEPTSKKMRFVERGPQLTVSTSFTDLFDPDSYAALSSGFPTRVVLHIVVYLKGADVPVAVQVIRKRVVYDLWDEVYLLEVEGPRGTTRTRIESRGGAERTGRTARGGLDADARRRVARRDGLCRTG